MCAPERRRYWAERFRVFALAGVIVVYAFLTLAALAKLSAIDEVELSLRSWSTLTPELAVLLSWLVPTLELFLAARFFFSPRLRASHGPAVVFLIVTTSACVVESAIGGPARCACTGVLLREHRWSESFEFVVLRNLAMLGLLLCHTLARAGSGSRQPSPTASAEKSSGHESAARARSAFTLIEMLCVVAVVAVLVALTIPAIAAVRQAARRSETLSHLRQNAALITLYARDWKDSAPAIVDSLAIPYRVTYGSEHIELMNAYFVGNLWHLALSERYLDGRTRGADLQGAHAKKNWIVSAYELVPTMMASPLYWGYGRDLTSLSQLGPVKLSAARFPDRKVMMYDGYEGWYQHREKFPVQPWAPGEPPVPVLQPPEGASWATTSAQADGSARRTNALSWEPPCEGGEYHPMLQQFHGWPEQPLRHTVDGILGRDLK